MQEAISRMLEEEIVISVPANRVGKLIGSRGAVVQAIASCGQGQRWL
mgnify:CR=1 FL=1